MNGRGLAISALGLLFFAVRVDAQSSSDQGATDSATDRASSPAPAPGTVTVPTESGDVVVTPGQATTTQTYVPPPGYPLPGADLNPGLPSSSRPIVGDQRDGFDLGQSEPGPPIVRGNPGASAVLSSGQRRPILPFIHLVRPHDTLWDLSAHYFSNPYRWPKIWSLNPQVKNPHWIYPGDQLRLRPGGGALQALSLGDQGLGGLVNRRPLVPPSTVFLRDQGYIGDAKRDVWGELVGAREDVMMLSEGNNAYLLVRPGVEVHVGQELTIFRIVRKPGWVRGARRPPGKIVKINGTVRIDYFNPKDRVARGEIVESLDIIERGAKIGPVRRRFDVVPPKQNQVELWARVLTSLYPHVILGKDQVVFIDKGSDDGLVPGNRLLVLRRGDTWRRGLKRASKMARDRVLLDAQENVRVETTPLHGDDSKFPQEVVGELRVLRTQKFTAIALVTDSRRELVPGDLALAKQGY